MGLQLGQETLLMVQKRCKMPVEVRIAREKEEAKWKWWTIKYLRSEHANGI